MTASRPSEIYKIFPSPRSALLFVGFVLKEFFSPYGDQMVLSLSGLIVLPALVFPKEKEPLFAMCSSRGANSNIISPIWCPCLECSLWPEVCDALTGQA